ncbi:hypothetical protein EDD11_000335 [Mortierella claussenii]|nr:hypothetical protein EDD11_000335 [Mortierella claussenii]
MSRLQEKLLELQTQQSQQAMREDRLRRAFSEPDGYFLLPRKEILEEEGEERNQNKYRATTLPLTRAQESKERRRMVMMGEEGHDDEMNDREMDDPGVSESAANAANVNVAEHIGTEVENKPHELEEAQRATQEALQIYYRAARVLRQTQEREEAIKFEYEMRALQGNSGCLHGDHAATRTRPAVGAERKGTRGAGDDAEEEEEGEEYTSLFSKDEGQALLAVDELPLFLQQERHEQKLPQQQQQHQGLPALSPIPGYEYILTPGAESSSCMREDNDQEEDMEGHGDASFKEYVFISPLMTLKTEQQDEATEPKVENDTTCTLSTASKGLGGRSVSEMAIADVDPGQMSGGYVAATTGHKLLDAFATSA